MSTLMSKDKRIVYILMIVLQCVLWGIGNPITKIAYESITPFWCLAFRFALAAVILAAIAGNRILAELRAARIADWMPAAFCTAGAYIACNIALGLANVTTVGFLVSLSVLFVPFIAIFVLRRPYRRAFLPVQLAASAGLYLLCSNGGGFSFGWGEALAVLAAACMSGALVWGEKGLRNLSPLAVSFSQVAVTAVLSFVGAFVFERGADLTAVRPAAWWVVVYLAVFCTYISYWLQNTALKHLPAGMVSLTQCTEPALTASASFLILGEGLTGKGLLGSAIILACIVYGNFIYQKPDKKPVKSD
ncbi:MAG: DMT family transporter [Clostridia bacterium]|nr:DMT family transporter [Clostridia bacterium]